MIVFLKTNKKKKDAKSFERTLQKERISKKIFFKDWLTK